jgi:hypothetical protein
VALAGDEASHLPDDADLVRRIFVQARTDPAVRLELAADHREAVVGVRFDDDLTVDRAEIMEHLQRYLDLELRRSLLQVDVDAPGAEPAARSFGRSLLAVDGRDRILRICDRSGRALSAAEAEEVQRVARQAATIPVADPTRLTSEIATATRDFIARHPFPLAATDTNHLVAAVTALDARASVDDVRVAVAAAYGTRLPDAILRSTAAGLARRVADVRRRLVARTNFRDMLYGAGLPTEGVLADEVRSATLETMGPIVGVPAAPDNPSALKIDPVAIGGTANDRALSETWEGSLRTGLTGTAGLISILLLATAGFPGIFRLPVAFAPLALASAPAALLGEPVGLPTLSFFAGALAAGAVLAVHATPPRHQDGDGR